MGIIPETCERITSEDYKKYSNRKKPGRISVLVNTRSEAVYLVPIGEEHIDFAGRIARKEDYPHLVPSHVDTEIQDSEPVIVGVVTGVCGLEIKLGVRHRIEDLEKAHDLTWRLINDSDLKVGRIRKNRIVIRYTVRNETGKYIDQQ